MPVNLTPGFRANIQIQDAQNQTLFEKDVNSSDEVKEFVNKYGKSKEGWGLFHSTVMPLRTDNFKDFAIDLFLPTFVHFAQKINNFAQKLFASVCAIAFDLLTFPVRLLTAPFRIHYNYKHPEEEHPMMQLIPATKESVVTLCTKEENVEIDLIRRGNGVIEQNAKRTAISEKIRVALKTLPGGTITYTSTEKEAEHYLRTDDEEEWVPEIGAPPTISTHSSFAF